MDARTIEKYLKLGREYKIKSLEINPDQVKIEFMEVPTETTVVNPTVDKVVTQKLEEYKKEQQRALDLDELSVMNPEAYEEHLAEKET